MIYTHLINVATPLVPFYLNECLFDGPCYTSTYCLWRIAHIMYTHLRERRTFPPFLASLHDATPLINIICMNSWLLVLVTVDILWPDSHNSGWISSPVYTPSRAGSSAWIWRSKSACRPWWCCSRWRRWGKYHILASINVATPLINSILWLSDCWSWLNLDILSKAGSAVAKTPLCC